MTIDTPMTNYCPKVKAELFVTFEDIVERMMSLGDEISQYAIEQEIRKAIFALGALLFAFVLGNRCRQRAFREIKERGLPSNAWRFRRDKAYVAKLTTSFGRIEFPLYAWRETHIDGSESTQMADLGDVHPLRGRCRSSLLLLALECKAGAEMPFRAASASLYDVTEGAIDIEDTTIATHLHKVGALIGREWQFRTPEEIAKILTERAVRDRRGRPLLYFSTDACMLRRYVDDTTKAVWKAANGIRIWAIDKKDGSTIHLGGEYTWGTCLDVVSILVDLAKKKILPKDGKYDGIQALIVVITDGAPWIHERVVPWFEGSEVLLDVFHLLQRLERDAKTLFGEGSKKAIAFMRKARAMILGKRSSKKSEPKMRRGRKNNSKKVWNPYPAGPRPTKNDVDGLLGLVKKIKVSEEADIDVRDCLEAFLERNLGRMNYRMKRWMGMNIGSGAMESLHRNAVQCRIKRPGARWLQDTSERIFAARMMLLSGRWKEFWSQPTLGTLLAKAFEKPKVATA